MRSGSGPNRVAKEAEARTVSVRSRAKGDEGQLTAAAFCERIAGEVRTRALTAKTRTN